MFCCLFCKHLVNQPRINYGHSDISREGEEEMSPNLEEMVLFLLSSLEKSLASSVSSLGGLLGTETKLGEALLIYLLSFPFGHFDRLKEPSWL